MDKNKLNVSSDLLDDALAAWRTSRPEETLSEAGKSNLFAEVRTLDEASSAPFSPSLTRAWRWAFLGSVPVVAIATVLIVAGDHRPAAAAHLAASKVNGQLVFTLANGKTNHVLYRSTDPQLFDRTMPVKMARNRYSENATGGPSLVFYRID